MRQVDFRVQIVFAGGGTDELYLTAGEAAELEDGLRSGEETIIIGIEGYRTVLNRSRVGRVTLEKVR